MACKFTDQGVISRVQQKRKLSQFIDQMILHYTSKKCQIQYVFATDEYVWEINKQFLHHDTYTDIITFDLSEPDSDIIVADICISIERVSENAQKFKTTYQHELLRVILHGALHLSGFADKTTDQAKHMRNLEEEWISKYLTS